MSNESTGGTTSTLEVEPLEGAEAGNGAWRMARRVGVAIAGSLVLGIGLILLVTPGPAFVVIPIGLGILSLEFDWARRWLHKVKEKIGDVLPHKHGKGHGDDQGKTSAR